MKATPHNNRRPQRGVVLISSLLLLLVVTIMALSMFRSFGIQEKIAGNVREKQRAVQGANSAQQYAEWWLANQSGAVFAVSMGSGSAADVACTNTTIDANTGTPQICNQTMLQQFGVSPASWPVTNGGLGAAYTPPSMNVTTSTAPDYYSTRPHFYIADIGIPATGHGEVFVIDAYGYGLSNTAIAVVESTVAVVCQICSLGGP